ncbi:MAG: L-serine ammonia-lyase [bacterium]
MPAEVSVFDLFKIGIGPSSSHTVGPMRAARLFVERLQTNSSLPQTVRLQVELFGSLALTGKGHGTDRAILLGLEGEKPELVDPDGIEMRLEKIRNANALSLLQIHGVPFQEKEHLIFHYDQSLPLHPNGMRFTAFDPQQKPLEQQIYYSIGGGFVAQEQEAGAAPLGDDQAAIPFPFNSGDELLRLGREHQMSIHQLLLENEKRWRPEPQIREKLLLIWQVMQECVQRGLRQEGHLPGHLQVRRRAPQLFRELTSQPEKTLRDPLSVLDWVNLYALAVNEENAAGGRVVTAPTNGAAGIVPAVLHYYQRLSANPTEEGLIRFFLAAGAIGKLYKQNASISGAEVGCQGEVGVACSMAAAGLVAALEGTNEQLEYAAEIGMEHNLGLTCDPVGGLVQIPCIERNAMGAVKAINAARMAMKSDGIHKVSLDQVITTMRQTGADMKTKYKETSQGGLAVNVIEC